MISLTCTRKNTYLLPLLLLLRIIYKNGKENLCCVDLHGAGKVFNV